MALGARQVGRRLFLGSRRDCPELGRVLPRDNVEAILFDHGDGVIGFKRGLVDAFVMCNVH